MLQFQILRNVIYCYWCICFQHFSCYFVSLNVTHCFASFSICTFLYKIEQLNKQIKPKLIGSWGDVREHKIWLNLNKKFYKREKSKQNKSYMKYSKNQKKNYNNNKIKKDWTDNFQTKNVYKILFFTGWIFFTNETKM